MFRGRDLRLSRRSGVTPERDEGRVELGVLVHGEPFVISWRRTGFADHAGALLGWGFLAALIALLVAVAARARLLLPHREGRVRRRSFQMQLTEALAAAVLIAILGVAVFAQQRLGVLLESASDREAVSRSFSVQRVAQELAALDPLIPGEELALAARPGGGPARYGCRALQRR